MHLLKSIIPITASIFIAACGGGDSDYSLVDGITGGGGGETPTDPENPTTPVIVIPTLALGTGSGSSFQSGALSITTSSLSAGGATGISVNIVDVSSNNLFTAKEVTVSFKSTCSGLNPAKATIDNNVTTSGGIAQTTYQAQGCTGTDTISASLTDGNGVISEANATVDIAEQVLGSIAFSAAAPPEISIKGVGSTSRPETSTISFTVLDANGDTVNGKTVSFALSSTLGGITLSRDTAQTDGNGIASTVLTAGVINTSVRVIATTDVDASTSISTTSNPIAINSGLPDQNSFDISVSSFNPQALNFNNVEVTVTVNVADYSNNPVPDGTKISFTSEEGGQIEGSCTTTAGTCSATWTSAGTRPVDGILTIIARSVGEESAGKDTNGNGLFDIEDLGTVGQLPEAFLDKNSNGVYDANDVYYDYNIDGLYTSANELFEGAQCSETARQAGHCSSLIDVRDSIRIILSGDEITFRGLPEDIDVSIGNQTICYTLEDQNGNTPAAGTAIAVSVTNGEIISGETSITVPNAFLAAPYGQCITIGPDDESSNDGVLRVEYTLPSPSGLIGSSFTSIQD